MAVNERIALLIKELGLNKNSFSSKMEESHTTVSNVIKGRNKPSFKLIDNIIGTYKVNPTWLFTGNGEMFLSESEANIIDKGNVHILESKASAGFGCLNSPESGLNTYYLPQLEGKPGTYIDIQVEGDSMEPTLYDGDRVIARKVEDVNDIMGGNVFVIDRKDGETLIKRLYDKGNEHFELISDNERYQPKELNKHEDINGLYRFELRITRRAWR